MRARGIIFPHVLIFFIFMFILGCAGKKAAPEEGILLTSFNWPEKQRITLSDLENEIKGLPEYKQSRYQDQKGKQEYLAEISETRMLVAVAKNLGLDKDPEIANKMREYRHQLMVEKLVDQEVDQKALASITDEDLQKYYAEHMKNYMEPEKVRLTCVAVTDKNRGEDIAKRIKEGEDIAKVAKENSDKGENVGPGGRSGGDTGFFSREDYSIAPHLVEVAFDLEKGQVSDLIEQEVQNQLYYMIFRLEDRQPERQQTFDEVKDDIRREVERSKKKERMDAWLEDLYKRSNLKISFDRLPPPSSKEGDGPQRETKSQTEPEKKEAQTEADEAQPEQKQQGPGQEKTEGQSENK